MIKGRRHQTNAIEGALDDYAKEHTRNVESLIKLIEDETASHSKYAKMMVGRVEGRFLRLLVQISNAERVLEIGTFTGYSALMMASALPENGCLITLEKSKKHAQVARLYFDLSGLGGRIVSVVGDAKETLEDIEGPFDMVFIDADKLSYDFYYEKGLSLLRPGGLIILDNVLWYGKVLEPTDHESEAIDRLNSKIVEDERVENVLLTVRDGVMLVRKNEINSSRKWREDLEKRTRLAVKKEALMNRPSRPKIVRAKKKGTVRSKAQRSVDASEPARSAQRTSRGRLRSGR